MALLGKGALINWSNVAPENRAEYYEWHNHEHIPDRLEVPGFRRGRRMIAVDADRDFFNLYEVDDVGVLTGAAYSARSSNPSPTYKRVGKLITDAIRAIAHVRYSAGMGQGGLMLTLRFAVADEASAGEPLGEQLMPKLSALPDIVGAHLLVADRAASGVVTADRQGRPTAVPDWAIILEATTREGLARARAEHLSEQQLGNLGCLGPFTFGLYALQIIASSDRAHGD
jgi:hypothetical protein